MSVKGQLTHWNVTDAKSDYATCEEFCELFANNVMRFYLLSLLLTADPEKAERCFVSGLDDCVNGISVFQDSLERWARRSLVRCAVRMIQPHAGDTAPRMRVVHRAGKDILRGVALQKTPFANILALKDFERFAFVLSVLEGHPDQSCAIMLRASREEVREARVRAIDHLVGICSAQVAYSRCPLSASQQALS